MLERASPKRLGGRIGDYQLVEEEHQDGRSHLVFLIHPRLEGVDANQDAAFFIEQLEALLERTSKP